MRARRSARRPPQELMSAIPARAPSACSSWRTARRRAPRTSSATTPTSAAGARRTRAPHRAAGPLQRDRRDLAAARDHARPGRRHRARRSRRPSPVASSTALGQKHSAPFIEDGVAELLGLGVERIVGIVLAPHFSTMSIAQYADRAVTAADGRCRSTSCGRGTSSPATSTCSTGYLADAIAAGRRRRRLRGPLHRAQPAAADPPGRATPTRTSSPRPPRRSPSAPASTSGRSPGRAPAAPRTRGSGRTSSTS